MFEHSRPIHHTKSDIFETAYICKRTGLRPNESSESAHQNRIFQTDLQSGLRLFFQRNLGKQMYGFKNGVEGALHSQTVHTNSDVHQTTSDLFVNESAVRPPETTESAVRNHDLFQTVLHGSLRPCPHDARYKKFQGQSFKNVRISVDSMTCIRRKA